MASLVALNNKVKVMVCGPGRSLDREGDQGVHMTKEIQHKMGDLRANLIPVVSADAVSWGSEVDSYGRNRPVQRAWAVVPPYLAAVPDFFSLTRTTWPGSVTLHIRDNILKLLKEGTSSKTGDGGSMSESEDVDMTGAALGGPPVGVTPGGQSSDAGQQVEGQIAAPKAPPKALVTKEMLASVRLKSPPNPPRSLRVSSPQVTATEVGNRWSSNLRTPRATIEEENAGGSAEVDDLLPGREGVDLPTDTFNDGGDPTEAEVLEFAGDVEMEPEKEAEAPAVRERLPVGKLRCLRPLRLRQSRRWNRPRRSERRLQPRSLEGAYTIMRTRRTRSIRERRPSWSQRKSGITVSMVPINPQGARGHRQDRRKAGRIGGSSFSE